MYSDRDMYCTIYQFILIGVALFASILLVIFSKLLTRPLVKLKDASKEVAEGNFNMSKGKPRHYIFNRNNRAFAEL